MNWNTLWLLYVHEMKMLVRGRRTVVMALVLPAVIMPLMLYAQKYSINRRERLLAGTTYRYAVTGPQADRLRMLIQQTQQSLDDIRDADVEKLQQFKLVEVRVANPTESLKRNEIEFYLETMTGADADKLPRETAERSPTLFRNSSAPG